MNRMPRPHAPLTPSFTIPEPVNVVVSQNVAEEANRTHQTFINGNTPYFAVAGSGGSAVSSFTTASISSLSVSSINGGIPGAPSDWSLYPAIQSVDMNGNLLRSAGPFAIGIGAPGLENTNAIFNADGSVSFPTNIGALNASASVLSGGLVSTTTGQFNNVNTGSINSATTIFGSNIVASTITVNTVVALSTVNAISTLSTTIVNANAINVSSINGNSPNWWENAAQSNVSMGGNYINGINALFGTGAGNFLISAGNDYDTQIVGSNVLIELPNSTIGTFSLVGNQSTLISASLADGVTIPNLIASTITTPDLIVSTINGNEINASTIVVGSTISADDGLFQQLTATAFSTLGAEIRQGLFSSISFKFDPTINIDTGLTSLVAAGSAFVGGCLGAFAGVAGGVGSGIYELGTGIAGAVAPRFDKYITNNAFETINQATQLQISTLGEQVSTIWRFTENVVSTNIYGSTATISVESFVSTLSPPAPFTAIRSLSDPLNLPSSPFEFFQYAGQWVPLPDSGLASNVSTIGLSTLQLLPSTILKGDLDGAVLEVLESDNGTNYGEVKSAGYWVTLDNANPNFGIYGLSSTNNPVWIDSNISTNLFALQGKTVEFNTVSTVNISTASIDAFQIVTSNINVSTAVLQNLTINDGNYALSQNLINTEDGGALIATYSNIVSPTGIYTVIQNLDPNPVFRGKAFFNMSGEHSTIGVNKQGVPGFTLDVEGDMRAKIGHYSAVYASSLLAPSTFVEVQSYVGTVELTPNSASWVSVNSGTVAGDAQGKIRFGISETETPGYNGTETYFGTKVYPGEYDGTSWTNYVGRPIRVEYSVLLDNSFPSGNGQAQFVLPIGFSTLQSCQLTLVGFGDNNPGFNHPPWLYSTINDGNGLISTLQVAGEANVPVFVSALGYV